MASIADCRILIVDDARINAKVVEKILQDKDFHTYTVEDGPSALKALETGNYDLVLLDVIMPEMDGFEVCRRMKQDPHLNEIPVIFLTADTEHAVEGFEAGGVDYVTKPFKAVELLARVRTHLTLRMAQKELSMTNSRLEDMVKERTRSLEQALKELDTFFYKSSHDLKGPVKRLEGIINILSIEMLEVKDSPTFMLLKQEVEAILNLNQNLIHLGNIRTKELEKVSVNVSRLIQQVSEKLSPLRKAFDVKIDYDLPGVLNAVVDQDLLEEVLTQITKNAIIHGRKRALINNVKMSLSDMGPDFKVIIEDSGPGFEPSVMDNLFGLFFRGNDKSNGLGLGLYASRVAVERHGGVINMENREEGGCRVVIRMNK